MYVTVAFLWISVWRFQDLFPILGKIQLPIMLEAALGIALVMSLHGPRKFKWTKSRIFGLPFLLLAIMVVGIPRSLWMGNSFIFITKVFMPSLLLMAGVALSVREAEDLNFLAFTHLIGATVYSTWTYLFVSIGSDGRLSGGAHYDANDFALMLVVTVPFAIFFLRPKVAIWKRLFALFSLALFVLMIIKSGSRGGFLAFIALILYVVIAYHSIPARLRIFSVGAAVLIMVVFASSGYWEMMRTLAHPKDDYNMTSQVGRKAIWKRGIGYMLSRPLVGVGANNFEVAEGSLSAISKVYAMENKGLKWSTAHNSFVLIGAELGIPGLIIFVTMIGTSFKRLSEIKVGPIGDATVTPEDAAFAQTLRASLIGFCIAGFFVSAAYFSFLYVLLGLVVAEDALRRRRIAHGAVYPVTASVRQTVSKPAHVPRRHWVPAG